MTIKISELSEISAANLLANTTAIFPVVSGTSSLETLRANLSSITDYIFANTVTTGNINLGNVAGIVSKTAPGTTNERITVRPSMNINGSGSVNAFDIAAMVYMLEGAPGTNGRVTYYPNTPYVLQHKTKQATGIMMLNCSVWSESTNDYVAPGLVYITAGNTTHINAYVRIGSDVTDPGDIKLYGQDIRANGNITVSNITINSATVSTSPYNGALLVQGGVGVWGNLNVGQNFTVGSGATFVGLVTAANLILTNNTNIANFASINSANIRTNITIGNANVRSNLTTGNLTVRTYGSHTWADLETVAIAPLYDYIASDTVGAGSPSPYEYSQCYIDTSTGALTPSLPAGGSEGFIKVFYMALDGGDCTLTVDDAAWKGGASGSVTFNDVGDTCTLMWSAAWNVWFILSSYGVTIA